MAACKNSKKTSVPKTLQTATTRKARPYPASSFTDALLLGEGIMKHAAGEKVRRLTLLQKMDKSPNSGPTKMMITNSGKYGITKGSYAAEYLELTEKGRAAVDPARPPRERRQASFDLAIDGVAPFKLLYDHYKDKRLPEREVIKDVLTDSEIDVPDPDECVDTFTVNVKDLDLLRTIGGAETLVSIGQVVEELPNDDTGPKQSRSVVPSTVVKKVVAGTEAPGDWQKICFYITPIGADDSQERRHSDLFMSSLVQPALEELGLTVVRADRGTGDDNLTGSGVYKALSACHRRSVVPKPERILRSSSSTCASSSGSAANSKGRSIAVRCESVPYSRL